VAIQAHLRETAFLRSILVLDDQLGGRNLVYLAKYLREVVSWDQDVSFNIHHIRPNQVLCSSAEMLRSLAIALLTLRIFQPIAMMTICLKAKLTQILCLMGNFEG